MDPLTQACDERQELRRRILSIADALGIKVADESAGGDVQAQWLRLCDQIDAKIAARRIINITP